MKSKLIVLGMLMEATTVLAYHGGQANGSGSGGTSLPGWAILLIVAVLGFFLYRGWRWWGNLNKF